MAKQDTELRQYAVIGAEQRLLQIVEEARHIFRAFPELRRRGRGFEATAGGGHFPWPFARQARAGGAQDGESRRPPVRRRRRRKLSADARKRISDAVKARWARQKGQAAASSVTPTAAGKKTTGRRTKKK